MATEIESPYWNIFEPPIENNSTESYEYVEYREMNVNVKDLKAGPYRLPHKDLNLWIHPHNSYLYLKGKVLKSDGTGLGDGELATLTNNGFNLFSKAKYKIEDKVIEDIDYPGIGTTVLNLVDFSDDYAKSAASNMFWYRDTADSADITRFTYEKDDKDTQLKDSTAKVEDVIKGIKKDYKFNEGFLKRWQRTKNSKVVAMFLPLNRLFGFCRDINRVFKGLPHEVELRRNDDNNIIHKSGTGTYKFELLHLSWFVPVVKPSLTMQAKLEAYLANGAINQIFWEPYMVHRKGKLSEKSAQIRVTTTQHKPSHIYVVFQKDSREDNQSETGMVFDHMNVSKLQVKVGNKKVPDDPYSLNFEVLDYPMAYTSFLSAGMKDIETDSGTQVSYLDFSRLYPIFHFDFTAMEPSVFENSSTPEIMVDYTLDKIPDSYYMYCIVVNERKATIQALDNKIYVIP